MDQFIERSISGLLVPQRNDRILDIGCGTGNHLLFLNKLGLDISGIDASPHMIDIARKRLGNRCDLKIGSAEDLPFSDNEFDFALLINTLEFLDDPLTALKEAGRVARKKILICVINSLSSYYFIARFRSNFHDTLLRHVRPYNLWEIKSLIRKAYGSVPVAWECNRGGYFFCESNRGCYSNPNRLIKWPFGSILWISVTLKPLVRTESHPLKIVVKKAEQPFAEGITTQSQCWFKNNDPLL